MFCDLVSWSPLQFLSDLDLGDGRADRHNLTIRAVASVLDPHHLPDRIARIADVRNIFDGWDRSRFASRLGKQVALDLCARRCSAQCGRDCGEGKERASVAAALTAAEEQWLLLSGDYEEAAAKMVRYSDGLNSHAISDWTCARVSLSWPGVFE
jgi:hypothetical protein